MPVCVFIRNTIGREHRDGSYCVVFFWQKNRPLNLCIIMYSSLFDGKEIPKNESKAGGDYVKFDAMRRLSDSVEEGHDLTAGAGAIDAEHASVRSGRVAICHTILRSPEDSLIVGVVHRNIAERRPRHRLGFGFALVSPDESHDLTARAGLVDAELTFSRSARVAGRNSFLLCP